MRRLSGVMLLAVGLAAGAAGGYYARPRGDSLSSASAETASPTSRKILYYRAPDGSPSWSAAPKKDSSGRDYLPVYEDEEPAFGPGGELTKAMRAKSAARKILYYRNPMGLPDTSPVPKKDPMGMDYIAVYEGDEPDDGKTVRVSLDKIQRSGVRTETVDKRVIVRPVRAVGTVAHDESRLTIVTMRSEGYIEDLFVNKTGQHVHAGVAEADLAAVKVGTRATVTVRAYMAQPIEGEVTFIYPELNAATRTARVRIEIANPENLLKPDMYADVMFRGGSDARPTLAVPASAVIDSGNRQVVLVAKG